MSTLHRPRHLESNIIQLFEFRQSDLPNRVAAILHAAGEPIGGEHAQRFTHWAAAHAELSAKPILGQAVLGGYRRAMIRPLRVATIEELSVEAFGDAMVVVFP